MSKARELLKLMTEEQPDVIMAEPPVDAAAPMAAPAATENPLQGQMAVDATKPEDKMAAMKLLCSDIMVKCKESNCSDEIMASLDQLCGMCC